MFFASPFVDPFAVVIQPPVVEKLPETLLAAMIDRIGKTVWMNLQFSGQIGKG